MGSMYQGEFLGGAIDVWIVCQLQFEDSEATCCYGGQISPLLSGTFQGSVWGSRRIKLDVTTAFQTPSPHLTLNIKHTRQSVRPTSFTCQLLI